MPSPPSLKSNIALLTQTFLDAGNDHLRGHAGDDETGKTDQRSDQVKLFQNVVDADGKVVGLVDIQDLPGLKLM